MDGCERIFLLKQQMLLTVSRRNAICVLDGLEDHVDLATDRKVGVSSTVVNDVLDSA